MEKNKIEKTKNRTLNFAKFKEKRGITLVALVVTIVVLLILAGVSINLIVNENGIMKRANEGKEKYGQAATNEARDLNTVESWMEDQFGEAPEAATVETAPYFPDNTFTKKEGTINTGLVIQDSIGNEYVWVVVPRTKQVYNKTDLGKTTFTEADYESIEKDLQDYTNIYRDRNYSDTWCADTANEGWFTTEQYTEAKNNMLKSVYLKGGFYVGRYEAGIEINRTANSEKDADGKYIKPTTTPITKADVHPYTYVTRTQAQKLAESVNSGNKTSSLMFGIQWDLVLAFMAKDTVKIKDTTVLTTDSTTIGNYYDSTFKLRETGKYAVYSNYNLSTTWIPATTVTTSFVDSSLKKISKSSNGYGILLTTGTSEQNKVMNIYDIAGNVIEWTLEKDSSSRSSPCVNRGGRYNDSGLQYPSSRRESRPQTYNNGSGLIIGFRVAIY